MTIHSLYTRYLKNPTICTDTRKIIPNCLFFALKGEQFDGNQYAAQAIELGAACVVIDDPTLQRDNRYVLVDNSLLALQDLARFHRKKLTLPVIAITGSNGKTTTKELVNSVLSKRYRTFATVGNLNNHIGVPLSILALTSATEVAIIEMGANHKKEIELLCRIAQPTHGIITNIGKAHLEGFGGFEGVIAAKSELYTYLSKTQGTAFINQDNPLLLKISRDQALKHMVYYGSGNVNYVTGKVAHTKPFLEIKWWSDSPEASEVDYKAKSHLIGSYNFENLLAAICVGKWFKLSPEEINAGIEAYSPTNNRSQLVNTEQNTVICDFYNANPTSIFFALENLANLDVPHKVIILGDMFELGEEAEKEHQAIIDLAKQTPASRRIFIGAEFYKWKEEGNEFYLNTKEALEALSKNSILQATILLKGSRGIHLEHLLSTL